MNFRHGQLCGLHHSGAGRIHKRIPSLLSANSGTATLSRPNLKVIGQSIEHLCNAFDQIRWTAPWQIRSTDTPFEHYVATDDPALLVLDKYDMAWSVARREQNLQF